MLGALWMIRETCTGRDGERVKVLSAMFAWQLFIFKWKNGGLKFSIQRKASSPVCCYC